jgi:light-regulated signal transduction histidine kinase (bacteriophytochrome)
MGPEADQYINYAVEAAKRMQHLIEDLLEYSRVERKTEEVSLIQSDEALASANQNLHSAITESGAVINSGPLPRIFADPTLLTQLFQNLIGNAIKFRKNEPPTISITAEKMDEDWVFSIRDNGIGMEKEYLERIFVIFQRLHARSQYPGTGIGLAIAKKIVERHGGRIWVESQPGMGTTFFFTFKGENGIRPSLEQ